MSAAPTPITPRQFDRGFRWRGDSVSRLECFSDAVFAIVLALLFLRALPPDTFTELKAAMKSMVPAAAAFAIIAYLWIEHWLFSRRYDLHDAWTALWNLVLLFLLLVYAYPLKYLFTVLFVGFCGPIGDLDLQSMLQGFGGDSGNVVLLYCYYSGGYGLIFLTLILLYRRAWKMRDLLQLDELERYQTRASLMRFYFQAGIAAVSIVLAVTGIGRDIGAPGWIYMVLGPGMGIMGWLQGRRVEALRGPT